MKTAKEMFEELGYKYGKTDYYVYYYKEKYSVPDGYIYHNGIQFFLESQDISLDEEVITDMDLLQAINKQVEELGWNKDGD